MEEYIKRSYISDRIGYYLSHSVGGEHYAYEICAKEIQNAPSADVAEVRRGVWEYWAGRLARCPVCGYEYTDLLECNNYCGNCGSQMSEEN